MDAFCKIYIIGDLNIDNLVDEFNERFMGVRDIRSIKFNDFSIYFGRNAYYDPSLSSQDEIILSKFYLDIEFGESADISECIKIVRSYIEWFKQKGIKVVPSCDYEDQLS
jgi:hypothetical protein